MDGDAQEPVSPMLRACVSADTVRSDEGTVDTVFHTTLTTFNVR
jgi:hypothetical protein